MDSSKRRRRNKSDTIKIITQSESTVNNKVYLKDVLIPLLTAIIVVQLNQFYFQENKILETQLEIKRDQIKEQVPILNRIINFTYKLNITVQQVYKVPVESHIEIDSKTGAKIDKQDRLLYDLTDTLEITAPSFILIESDRTDFYTELEYLKNNKHLLNHEIIIKLDELLHFLKKYPFPDIKNTKEVHSSEWCKTEIMIKWQNLIFNLSKSAEEKIQELLNF